MTQQARDLVRHLEGKSLDDLYYELAYVTERKFKLTPGAPLPKARTLGRKRTGKRLYKKYEKTLLQGDFFTREGRTPASTSEDERARRFPPSRFLMEYTNAVVLRPFPRLLTFPMDRAHRKALPPNPVWPPAASRELHDCTCRVSC
jgi:hypothetical protein